VQAEDIEVFETLFKHIQDVGYGADRTTGKGQFRFLRDQDFDPAPFQAAGSHRLSLSVCAAADLKSFEGYWTPFVKHGRAWNGFGEQNPFKKPFFAFAEGSIFRKMPQSGYLLRNIHSDPRIVQIGWPLTIPVTLEEPYAD
jgi:CRISPR-associated protein Csm4